MADILAKDASGKGMFEAGKMEFQIWYDVHSILQKA